MKVESIDINDAQSQFKELVSRVAGGVRIVLCENDKPVAEMVPLRERIPGFHEGSIWTSDDFDAPLCFCDDDTK